MKKSLLMAVGGCRRLCPGFGIGSSSASLLQYTYKHHHHHHHHHHILQSRTNLNNTYSSLPLSNPNRNPQSSSSTVDSCFCPLLLLHQHQHHRCGLLHQSAAASVGIGGVEGGGALTHRLYYSTKSDSDSSSSSSSSSSPSPSSSNVDMKHQEIEGPTVERDLSPLANETREVSIGLMKTMYRLSNLLAVLGLSQLAVGSTFYFLHQSTPNTPMIILMMMMNNVVVGFALPFSMAFMLRHSLKSMHFFHKMEQLSRLQILTSTMQLSKQLHLFFSRFTSLTYLCLARLPLPLLLSFSSSSS